MTKEQARKTMLDLSKLSWGTLRKYQFYFKVKHPAGEEMRTKERVVEAVEHHFEEIKIDTQKLIFRFLKIKKDEKND